MKEAYSKPVVDVKEFQQINVMTEAVLKLLVAKTTNCN